MDLVGYMKQEDKDKVVQREKKIKRKRDEYIGRCKEDGEILACINTIVDWLSDKTGVNKGDLVQIQHETGRAILINKFKAPLYKQVVLFEVWLPKSQIDFDII